MKFNFQKDESQVCPRCDIKCPKGTESCPECGLIFSRLKVATNKEAKNKILRHDRDFIVKTKTIPSDVSYIKLLLLSIFCGMFGAHCFYVGRYLRGSIILTDFIALIMLVIFNSQLASINNGALLGVLSTITGIIMLMWIWDIIMIIIKKFKIPVAIDIDNIIEHNNSKLESFDIEEQKDIDKDLQSHTQEKSKNKDEENI